MNTFSTLPHVIALINAATILVLGYGYSRIRAGDQQGHRRTMYWAIGLGALFIAVYLTYHALAGLAKFGGVGPIRVVYFTLLVAHIVAAALAAVIVPVAIACAIRGRFTMHRRIARFALPMWMFVSTSGLIVYFMTIHLYPFRA
ncbi:MAG: DUF420 domain-containing protein [Beijerinckiaceae bacterium]